MAKGKRKLAQVSPVHTNDSSAKEKAAEAAAEAAAPSSSAEQRSHNINDSEQEYEAQRILKETKTKYLIKWEDNPETGESYDSTWEPKRYANEALVEEWESIKAATKVQGTARASKKDNSTSKRKAASPVSEPAPKRTRRRRQTRIKESPSSVAYSPPVTRKTTVTCAQAQLGASETFESEWPIAESPQPAGDSPLFEPSNSPAAVVNESPISYEVGDYKRVGASTQTSAPAPSPPILLSDVADIAQLRKTTYEPGLQSQQAESQGSPPEIASSSSRAIPDFPNQQVDTSFQNLSSVNSFRLNSAPNKQGSQLYKNGHTTQESEVTTAPHQESLPTPVEPDAVQLGAESIVIIQEGQADETLAAGDLLAKRQRAHSDNEQRFGGTPVHQLQPIVESDLKVTQGAPSRGLSFLGERYQEQAVSLSPPKVTEPSQQQLAPLDLARTLGFVGTDATASDTSDQPVTRGATAEKFSSQSEREQERVVSQPPKQLAYSDPPRGLVDISGTTSNGSDNPATLVEHTTQATASSAPQSFTQAGTTSEEGTFISSVNPSISDSGTLLNYKPPSAGQRSSPSSSLEADPSAREQDVPNTAFADTGSATRSSFPFRTLVPLFTGDVHGSEARESPPKSSPISLYNPDLPASPRGVHKTQSILSQEPRSSAIPSVPSHPLRNITKSSPANFTTPNVSYNTSQARASMEATSSTPRTGETLSLSVKLQSLRSRNRSESNTLLDDQRASALPTSNGAEVAAARSNSPVPGFQEGTRSPSIVPAMEPTPEITKEEMNTSERYDTLLPQAQAGGPGSQGPLQNGAFIRPGAGAQPRQPGEDSELINTHVVPVSLRALQRDQYSSNLYYYQQTIDRFLAESEPDEELLAQAETLIERLRSTSMHLDLTNSETLSQISTPERQAQWDADSSGKFHFLKELLQTLEASSLPMHVAIAVQGDRAPDIVEIFLKGLHVPYKRNSSIDARLTQLDDARLRVSIVDLDKNVQEIDNVDLVIAMDGNVETQHRLIQAFRRHARTMEMSEVNQWAMLLILVAPRTIEHIERCMAPNVARKARMRIVLRAALTAGADAGKSEPGQSSRKDAAALIASYLDSIGGTEDQEWPLTGLSVIQDLDSETETELVAFSTDDPSSYQDDGTAAKRPFGVLDIMPAIDTAKRPRLSLGGGDTEEMVATMDPQDLDITHISDLINQGPEPSLSNALPGPNVTEVQLLELLKTTQDQLDEHKKALEGLQYRHEDQHIQLIEIKRSYDQTTDSAQVYLQRMTLAEATNTALRTECSDLKQQLEDAVQKLLSHSVPEQAELERLRIQAQQADLDKGKAEKRAETIQRDLDWTREMYQDASSKAQGLGKQNQDLQNRLAVAEKKASGERVRAQEISKDMRNMSLERSVKKLQARLNNSQAMIKAKDDQITDLKQSGRGRISTRNSSVPRSPRLGSPIKAARSRQPSPAGGESMRRSGSYLNPSRAG